jgi:hypothetical protein
MSLGQTCNHSDIYCCCNAPDREEPKLKRGEFYEVVANNNVAVCWHRHRTYESAENAVSR